MSLQQTVSVPCIMCESPQEMTFWSSVTVTINPELKRKVFDNSLNMHRCTSCNQEYPIGTPLLYHDMANRLMVRFDHEVTAEELAGFQGTDELRKSGYILRYTNDYPRMVEKVLLFDSGVNDQVVDKARKDLLSKLDGMMDTSEVDILFGGIQKKLFSKKLVFEVYGMMPHPTKMLV